MGSKADPKTFKAKPTEPTPAPETTDLAALMVLHAVSKVIGPKRAKAMGRALLEAVDDWTRDEPPPHPALRNVAERFGRPAARMLLAEDTPPAPMPPP